MSAPKLRPRRSAPASPSCGFSSPRRRGALFLGFAWCASCLVACAEPSPTPPQSSPVYQGELPSAPLVEVTRVSVNEPKSNVVASSQKDAASKTSPPSGADSSEKPSVPPEAAPQGDTPADSAVPPAEDSAQGPNAEDKSER